MKTLLINSPIRLDAEPNCIPYGLATIAAVLRAQGFHVEIYDVNALRPSKEEISKSLKDMTWDLVGLSGLITTYKFQKWLIPELKAMNPEAPVISGGGLATSNNKLLFQNSPLDVAVIGEGEKTMLEWCLAFAGGLEWRNIPGICYQENGSLVTTSKRGNIQDLDSVPFPSWHLLPMEVYLKHPIWGDAAYNSSGFRDDVSVTRSMNVISSRGCPFSCNYCYHLFGRSNYRLRSAQNVVDEIEALVDQYGVDFIGFVDDNMMASEKRLIEFCDLMERKQFPLTWGCHGRVTSARDDLLKRMADTGCVWIGYGIESGSQKILDAMNKKAKVEQAKQAVIETRKAGIYPNTTFIFGYPGETRQTIQETINFKRELALECGSFFATPYPGAPLYDEVKGRIEDEEAFICSLGNATDFSVNLTNFDDKTLLYLKKAMDENRDVIG